MTVTLSKITEESLLGQKLNICFSLNLRTQDFLSYVVITFARLYMFMPLVTLNHFGGYSRVICFTVRL